MRVAITGASGMLGRFVVDAVALEDHEVIAIDVARSPDRSTVLADVLDPKALAGAMAGCDAVIHLAAIDQARSASEQVFFSTNVLGTWNVLMVAERLHMRRAVICSSVAALGLSPQFPPDSLPIAVEHALRPVSAYGISKQAAETVAAGFVRRGKLQVICLRPALVTFPHHVAGWERAAALADGASPAARSSTGEVTAPEPLPLTGAYVGPHDAGRAFAAALRAEGDGFTICYVTADDTMSRRPTIQLLAERMKAPSVVTQPLLYSSFAQASPFDLEPSRMFLNWSPSERWADIVARYASRAEGSA